MPALETPVSSTDEFPSHLAAAEIVRWQPLACLDLFCEIHSPESLILRHAKVLFGASGASTLTPLSARVLRWRVARDAALESPTRGRWIVRDLNSGVARDFKNEARALTYVEYSAVQSVVDEVRSGAREKLFAIHGALLHKNDCAIVVVGPSEAGKSTLSCALWRNGWSLLSDDFCFLRADGEYSQSQAFPAARRVSLRNGSRELLGEETWTRIQNAPSSAPTEEGWIFHPHEIGGRAADAGKIAHPARRAPVPVSAFIFLGRRGSSAAPGQARRVEPAHAAISLLPFCTLLKRPQDAETPANGVLDWGAALAKIAPVAARTPVYDVARGPLEVMCASVENLRDNL